MKNKAKKKLIILYMFAVGMLFLSGCGAKKGTNIPNTPSAQTQEETTVSVQEEAAEQELYMITGINSAEESIQVYRFLNGKEYRFYYTVDTVFRDKYKNRSTVSEFFPGKIIYIGKANEEGRLSEIAMADTVWQYDDIVRFSIDEEKGILKIADTNYRITDQTRVFSDGSETTFSTISENDILSVTGQDKNILSVQITTGHGDLQLINTDLFEGSFLQLNTNIFAEVTPEMKLELPEGEYLLTVANNGWGGSCRITVTRGETVAVDLDSIKGEGPKYGSIRFVFDVEEAILIIDGETVDYSEPVTLQYGKHLLKVNCNGYNELSKYLFVNSEEATIMIDINPEEEEPTEEIETESQDETESTESTGDETEENTENEEENLSQEDILKDYLSTLTELIESM